LAKDRNTSTPHKRLIAAIAHVISRDGYEAATVTDAIGRADVSRATFYEHFASKEAGFLAALEVVERNVLTAVVREIGARPRRSPVAAAIGALVSFAHEHPEQARLLVNEAMGAGPRALGIRDRAVDEIARVIEDARQHMGTRGAAPALPGETLIGTACRLLGSRLRHGKLEHEALGADLLEWIAAYERPQGELRWPALPARATPRSPSLARAPLHPPPALAPGRPRRSSSATSENHRLRIVFATAEIVCRDGYPAASVAAITRAAGVDSRGFYALFAGKHAAFRDLRELSFQQAMAVTSGAFFTAEDWPRRIWEAASAFAQLLAQNPSLGRACLLESNAGGSETVERLEELVAGCTIFLQEGYRYQPRTERPPSQVTLEAIALAELEIVYRALGGSAAEAASLAGRIAYVCLAPFLGVARTGELIQGMRES